MSSSIGRVAKRPVQKQPVPVQAHKCACGGDCRDGEHMAGAPHWVNQMPKDVRRALINSYVIDASGKLQVSADHVTPVIRVPEAPVCLVCDATNVKKRGLCPACHRQCHRMVMMDETTWYELSKAGCCTSDLTDKNHMRRSMITERIAEYRRGGN